MLSSSLVLGFLPWIQQIFPIKENHDTPDSDPFSMTSVKCEQ